MQKVPRWAIANLRHVLEVADFWETLEILYIKMYNDERYMTIQSLFPSTL